MSDRDSAIDWTLTTWEGSRREQIRRAARLPFDTILDMIEEMETLATGLAGQANSPPIVAATIPNEGTDG